MTVNTKKQKTVVTPFDAGEALESASKHSMVHYRAVLTKPVPERLSALIRRLRIIEQTKG